MSFPIDDPHKPNEKELRNLKDKGILCSIRDAWKTRNCIVIGKIVKIHPIVRKSKYQSKTVLLIELEDIFKPTRRIFKAMFIEKAAELLDNNYLEVNDYLLFLKKPLYKITSHHDDSYSDNKYAKQFVIGLWPESNIEGVYYRRKTGNSWIHLKYISSPASGSGVNEVSDENIEDDNDSSILTQDVVLPHREVNSEPNDLNSRPPDEPRGAIRMNENGTSRSVMCNIIEQFQSNSNGESKTEKGRDQKVIESNQYEYVKLKDIEKGNQYNVYTILTKILKKPTVAANMQYHMIITVMDDTKFDVNVHIFGKFLNGFPQFQQYSIVRFHRLRVQTFLNADRLSLKSNARDILVFDKNDITTHYHVSKTFTLTDDDQKKAKALRDWMLDNVVSARPFTTLSTLDFNQRKINLRCEVVDIKAYVEPVIVLRIKDGTKANISLKQIDFNIDTWAEAISAAKQNPDGEIEQFDVIITEPDSSFRKLKIGDHVELYNVEVSILQNFNKTKSYKWLKIHLKGCWKNVKYFKPQGNWDKLQLDNEPSTSGLSITSQQKKRKLFDPDQIVDFESDAEIVETREKNAEKNIALPETSTEKNPEKRRYVEADVNSLAHVENSEEGEQLNAANDLVHILVKEAKRHNITIDVSNENSRENEVVLSQAEPSVEINQDNRMLRNLNNDVAIESYEAQNHTSSPEIVMGTIDTSRKQSNRRDVLNGIINYEQILNESQPFEEDENNYLTQWPEDTDRVFNIRVQLLTTNPIIDVNSSEADIASIISSYCDECVLIFPYNELEFDSDEVLCPSCKKEGRSKDVKFLIALELLLRDQCGDAVWAVVLAKTAEKFLDCTIEEICTSVEVRSKIIKMIDSYSTRLRKKGPMLLVRILPFNTNKERFKYHIIDVKFCDQ